MKKLFLTISLLALSSILFGADFELNYNDDISSEVPLTLEPGTYTFQVVKIPSDHWVRFNVNSVGVGADVYDNSNLTSPKFTYTVTSSCWISIYVWDENWGDFRYYQWNITLAEFKVNSINAIVTPSSVDAGDLITRSATVSGTGNGTVNYRWEYKAPGSSTWDQLLSKTVTMTNGSATITPAQINASGPEGTHYYRIVTTSPNSVTSNQAGFYVSTPPPDLIVSSVSLNKTSVQAGSSVDVTFTVKNQGDGDAYPVYAGIYLSDTQYGLDDYLTNVSISGLSGGASKSYTKTITIPSGATAKTYYIDVWVDYLNDDNREAYETNNVGSKSISIYRFEVASINATVTPSSVDAGDLITRSATVSGTGNGTVIYRWEYKAPGSTSWDQLLSKSVTMTNGSATISPAQINASGPEGTHYYRIVTTSPNSVTSNQAGFYVSTPPPDLTISSVSLSKSSVQAGDNLDVTFTVENIGDGDSYPVFAGIYISETQYNLETFLDYIEVSSINGKDNETYTKTVSIPSGLPAGTYYIDVFADYIDEDSREINELNNVYSKSLGVIQFTVTSVIASATPTSVDAGDLITRSAIISGTGNGTVNYRWEYKAPGSITWDQLLSKSVIMTDGSATISPAQINASGPEGTHYYRVVTTSPNNVTSNEAGFDVSTPLPDLTVSFVSLNKSSVHAGDNLDVTFTVDNIGEGDSYPVYAGIYISENQYYLETFLDHIEVSSINGKDNDTYTKTVTIPSDLPAGTYYIDVFADYIDEDSRESNEINNVNSASFILYEDHYVTDIEITVTPSTVEEGELITKSATISGIGDGTISYRWEIKDPGASLWQPLIDKTVAMTGGSATVTPLQVQTSAPTGIYYHQLVVTSPNTAYSNEVSNVVNPIGSDLYETYFTDKDCTEPCPELTWEYTGLQGTLVRLSSKLWYETPGITQNFPVPLGSKTIHFDIKINDVWTTIVEDGITTTSEITSVGYAIGENYYLIPDNMPPETYNIRAVFNGDDEYNACVLQGTLTVSKPASEMSLVREHDENYTGESIALVLVHGNGADRNEEHPNSRWSTFINYIKAHSEQFEEFDVYNWFHTTEIPVGFNGYTGNARRLKEDIDKYIPNKKIVFVAHSQGGLICRSFMNYGNNCENVLGLITLGTPHHGSPFAVPDWAGIAWGQFVGQGDAFNDIYSSRFAGGGLNILPNQFEYDRVGSLSLGWDNLDDAIQYVKYSFNNCDYSDENGDLILTPFDVNAVNPDYTSNDNTILFSESLKNLFGTLQQLNDSFNYFDKVIAYGAYDDNLNDNAAYLDFLELLNIYTGIPWLFNYEHQGLEFITSLLASFGNNVVGGNINYYANDGMVPLQSALYLDISDGVQFASESNKYITTINLDSRKRVKTQRIFSGTNDGLKDHLDLLDADLISKSEYWDQLKDDIRSFIPGDDNELPTISFNSVSGEWYNSNEILDIDFSDNMALDNVWYQIDSNDDSDPNNWHLLTSDGTNTLTGSQNNSGTSLTSNWKISNTDWDNLTYEMHHIYFKVTDDAGNVLITPDENSAFEFGKDVLAPTIYFTSPNNSDLFLTNEVEVSWNSSDVTVGLLLSGIDKNYFALDQSTNYTEVDGTVLSHTFSGLSNGLHTAYIKTKDKAGNESSVEELSFSVHVPEILNYVSGNNQSEYVSSTLHQPFVVSVEDSDGNGVEGIQVDFNISSVPSGANGHNLSENSVVTNASGLAWTTLSLGDFTGEYIVSSTSDGLTGSPVNFSATAIETDLPLAILYDVQTTSVLCYGDQNGSVLVSGATQGINILDKGVIWSTVPDIIAGGKRISAGSGVGEIFLNVQNLSTGIVYVAIYAEHNNGTVYSNVEEVVIVQPDDIGIGYNSDIGSTYAHLEVQALGGTPPYTYNGIACDDNSNCMEFGSNTNGIINLESLSPSTSYDLELTIIDAIGCTALEVISFITTSEDLLANFTASERNGYVPLEVSFSDLSQGNPTSWLWNFGDGITSTEQNPVHTYSDPGLYHVRLIVYNNFEGDTLVKENYIEVIEQPLIIQDSLALVALYNSTDGPNWTNNENWLTAEPISSWYGITVENGRVTSIHLSFNNLTGYLPPEIGQLTELVDLIIVSDMSENSISGNIPFEIGLLGNLVNLNLMQNRITGSIPVETGQLLHLEHLDLRSNLLTGSIPSELGQLENLQWLFLYRNQLSGNIPNELGQLSNLSLFEMSDNQLSGSIPTEIGQLTNLSSFTVGSNNLSGVIPAGLCNLPLEWVNFENNQFDSESCPTIQCLIDNNVNFDNDPDQTQQSGFSLMNDCGEEFNLQTDSLALVALYNATDGPNWTNNENWLVGPLNTWHGVKVETDRVTELLIGQNNLNGYIPPEIGQLTMINRIFIEQNNLAGAIPEEIGQLTNLNYLYLRDNQLTGEIPSTLYQLTNLTRLNLGDNQLIGILTPEIGLLSNLVELHLHGNNLTGTIPSELGKLKKLDQLGFNNNQFSGTLPVELAGLDSLMYLGLGANQLTGSIPSEYGQLEKIWNIELFSNQLSGEIPDELGQLISIRILNLAENQLLGTIPSSFGQLIYLRDLNLRRNEISGKIPEEFGQLTNLEWLLLGDNHLIDTVPLVLNTLVNLRGLGVENNFINYLPDFSSTPNLSNLYCENNRLDFGDLEPNIEILSYTYSPQDSIGQNIDTILQLNENFEFQLETGGSHNLYQWYKEGVLLPAQTTETLNIESLIFADAGSYQCEVTNSLVTGLTLHSRLLNIAVVENQCQIISLNAGWNIFSSVVTPDPAELQFNFQSLIDNNSLVKVQDEGGWSLEDHGIYGGWQNDIGNISPAEGYKVKVNTNTELQMCGNLVEYPYRIYLFEGWNIMGYPHMQTVDAMEVVQQLIDNGTLIKVQNEQGNSIENLGIFGGWQNFIGNFQPGEGYKIKVSSQDSLWIYESYPKSTVTLSKPLNLQHFNIAISGNGVDHMNFNLVDVNEKLLAVGDEISVYDGTTCAGAMVITEAHLRKGIVSIPASATDESGMPGFTEGNPFSLRIWKADQNREIEVETEHISGPELFTKHESVILSLDKSALTKTDEWNGNGSTEVNCYPNPFSQEITIELILAVESKIQVVVLNQMGQEVKYLATKSDLNSGIHRMTWDGSNSAGNRVPHGMYYLKIILDDLIICEKIIYNKL